MKLLLICILFAVQFPLWGQSVSKINYRVEASTLFSDGDNAPLWFSANRYGLNGTNSKQFLSRAGVFYQKDLKHHWTVRTGLDVAGGVQLESDFWVHQAYADFSWRMLNLSVGSKERKEFPLDKSQELSSGYLVEGFNTRPIPQIRAEIKDYLAIPGTRHWVALKGHLAYGWFMDGNWQEDFVGVDNHYVKRALYHSKSLMFRLGNKQKLPLEFEFGLLMATQFGGNQYLKHADGSSEKTIDMPSNLEAYWKAFFPHSGGDNTIIWEQVNVEGNMLGSWNFALNYYPGDWKIKAQYEHYFDDHSQMFWQYGRWKDGQLGIEIDLPDNKWISQVLWEGLSTKDQTKGVLYDGYSGSFPEFQMSGADDYYNHLIYGSWQHYGMGMGNPLLPGPIYNADGSMKFKSNRVRANHLGVAGNPSSEWSWKLLASFARHWGTYTVPLDKQRKQFSGMVKVNYSPVWASGWKASLSLGLDRGNYLDNTFGGMITISKRGGFSL